jgi:hypothetical protein
MRILVLSIIFASTVALMTVACWLSREGQGAREGTEGTLLPIVSGMLITLSVQSLGWNALCKFPEDRKRSLVLGLSIATTLMALGLGMFLDAFMPAKRDVMFDVAITFVTIGAPAFLAGLFLFWICAVSWSGAVRQKGGHRG